MSSTEIIEDTEIEVPTPSAPTPPAKATPARTGADHAAAHDQERAPEASRTHAPRLPPETGGPKGPEPTRFGDWEQKGRCTDF